MASIFGNDNVKSASYHAPCAVPSEKSDSSGDSTEPQAANSKTASSGTLAGVTLLGLLPLLDHIPLEKRTKARISKAIAIGTACNLAYQQIKAYRERHQLALTLPANDELSEGALRMWMEAHEQSQVVYPNSFVLKSFMDTASARAGSRGGPRDAAPARGEVKLLFALQPHRQYKFTWRGVRFDISKDFDKNFLRAVTKVTAHTNRREIMEEWLLDVAAHWQSIQTVNTNINLYRWNSGWSHQRGHGKTSNLVMPAGVYEDVLQDLRGFMDNEAFYEETGVPYRRGYMFAGPPGSGKTSMVLQLASELGMDVALGNLAACTYDDEVMAMLTPPHDNCLIVLEDVDAALPINRKQDGTVVKSQSARRSHVTFSGILNAMDGIATPHGRILIVTTNHPESLDPAFVRGGRIDKVVEFGVADAHQITSMARRFKFSEEEIPALVDGLLAQGAPMSKVQETLRNLKMPKPIEWVWQKGSNS